LRQAPVLRNADIDIQAMINPAGFSGQTRNTYLIPGPGVPNEPPYPAPSFYQEVYTLYDTISADRYSIYFN
jgi:hypothetical protein